MSASLRPDLFGISNTDLAGFKAGTETLSFNDDSCTIGFNSTSNLFQTSEKITHCGNVASNADP